MGLIQRFFCRVLYQSGELSFYITSRTVHLIVHTFFIAVLFPSFLVVFLGSQDIVGSSVGLSFHHSFCDVFWSDPTVHLAPVLQPDPFFFVAAVSALRRLLLSDPVQVILETSMPSQDLGKVGSPLPHVFLWSIFRHRV